MTSDAKGLFKAAIRDDNPVLVFEDRLLYSVAGDVPDGEHVVPLGVADIKRRGRDATIVATGRMIYKALAAAKQLSGAGIEVEVVDPRTLVPLDVETLVASVKRTNRALVVDGGSGQYGAAGEIAAVLADEAFDWLDAPVRRIAAENVPIPMSRTLEPLVQPSEGKIVEAVRELVGRH